MNDDDLTPSCTQVLYFFTSNISHLTPTKHTVIKEINKNNSTFPIHSIRFKKNQHATQFEIQAVETRTIFYVRIQNIIINFRII
jgi:hypothetical protein